MLFSIVILVYRRVHVRIPQTSTYIFNARGKYPYADKHTRTHSGQTDDIEKSRCWTGYLAVSQEQDGSPSFAPVGGGEADSSHRVQIYTIGAQTNYQLKSFGDCCHWIYSTTFDEGSFPSGVRTRTNSGSWQVKNKLFGTEKWLYPRYA